MEWVSGMDWNTQQSLIIKAFSVSGRLIRVSASQKDPVVIFSETPFNSAIALHSRIALVLVSNAKILAVFIFIAKPTA